MKTLIVLLLLASPAMADHLDFIGQFNGGRLVSDIKTTGCTKVKMSCQMPGNKCRLDYTMTKGCDPIAIVKAHVYVDDSPEAAAQAQADKKTAAQSAFDKMIQTVDAMSDTPVLSVPEKAALSEQIVK